LRGGAFSPQMPGMFTYVIPNRNLYRETIGTCKNAPFLVAFLGVDKFDLHRNYVVKFGTEL